ncbi:MAG: GNAT family N-acetyltransferase [Bacteroidales bacterium]|nr:GNAT family N-acetyltransferase [Bacteroidales bacterium]
MAADKILKNISCREHIRLANENDICAIREIWRNIFTPKEDYLDIIFKYLYRVLDAFVFVIDEKIASVAFAIPMALFHRDENYTSSETYHGRYLYGVATIEEARGRGLSRVLVEQIKDYYTAGCEDFIITRPAEESLFPFYKAQGFTQSLYRSERVIRINQPSPTLDLNKNKIIAEEKKRSEDSSQTHLSGQSLFHLRARQSTDMFIWGPYTLDCILHLAKTEENLIKFYPQTQKYIIAYFNGNNLIVEENNFNSTDELLHTINLEITRRVENITIFMPAGSNSESQTVEFALYMPLSGKISKEIVQKSFFNFTME